MRSNAGLDQFYEQLFRKAYRATRKSQNVELGIQLVVFGTFWLEAKANSMLRRALILEVRRASLAPALWEALKRAALPEKLNLFLSLASNELQKDYRELSVQLRHLLDLRNRLAHFKDDDTPVSGPVNSMEDAIRILETANEPPLISELKRPQILKHGVTISALAQWLKRFEREHTKARNIGIRNKKAPRNPTKRSDGPRSERG